MKNTKVLFLDDDTLTLKVAEYYLREVGQLVSVSTFQHAIDQLKKNYFDIAILDYEIDFDRSGIDVLLEAKSLPHLEQTSFICVSSHTLHSDRVRILSSGFDAFLPKPFFREDLLRVIRDRLPKSLNQPQIAI